MSKIKEVFAGKKIVIGFLTAGDPCLEKTEEFVLQMERAGAGVVEIGIPFSDPIAEGPIVQAANVRALSAPGGCTTEMIFDMVSKVSKKTSVPLVLVTYLNPVYNYGYEKFCRRCQESGISGLRIPDLPFEEKGELAGIAKRCAIELISSVAPNGGARIGRIAEEAQGYLDLPLPGEAAQEYLDLPLSGEAAQGYLDLPLSGEAAEDVRARSKMREMYRQLSLVQEQVRRVTDTPLVVELDAAAPDRVRSCAAFADGVLVRSALVQLAAEYGAEAGPQIYDCVKSLTEALSFSQTGDDLYDIEKD